MHTSFFVVWTTEFGMTFWPPAWQLSKRKLMVIVPRVITLESVKHHNQILTGCAMFCYIQCGSELFRPLYVTHPSHIYGRLLSTTKKWHSNLMNNLALVTLHVTKVTPKTTAALGFFLSSCLWFQNAHWASAQLLYCVHGWLKLLWYQNLLAP